MRLFALLAIVLSTPLWALAGCGGASIADICQRACECVGNCDTQQDECERNGEAYEELASELGCSDSWDAYVSCLDENLVCTDGEVNEGACSAELSTFESDCSTTAG